MNNQKILVVVESPDKATKIQKILGNDYIVIGSKGHILELDSKNMSVDLETFTPKYSPISYKFNNKTFNSKTIIDKIKYIYKTCKTIYIATDDDREGEMIGWCIEHVLGLNNSLRMKFKILQNKLF